MSSAPIVLSTPADTWQAGRGLAALLRAGDVVILTGPLGAGKTTFTRGLAEGLRVRGPITSPTFVLARRHPSLVGGPALEHVDAYRLASADELWDLDIDADDAVIVVEWGRGMAEELSGDHLEIELQRESGSAPEDFSNTGQSAHRQPARLAVDSHTAADPRVLSWRSAGERWEHEPIAQSLQSTQSPPA